MAHIIFSGPYVSSIITSYYVYLLEKKKNLLIFVTTINNVMKLICIKNCPTHCFPNGEPYKPSLKHFYHHILVQIHTNNTVNSSNHHLTTEPLNQAICLNKTNENHKIMIPQKKKKQNKILGYGNDPHKTPFPLAMEQIASFT